MINVRRLISYILIIILVIAVSFPSIQSFYYKKIEDWKGISQYLVEHSRSGDVIVIEPDWQRMNLLHYYDPNLKNTMIRTIDANLTELEDIVSKNERVWVVYGESPWSVGNLEIGNWLHSRYGLGERFLGKYENDLYLIQPTLFKVAIFHNLEWSPETPWMSLLGIMGASINTFNDTTLITNVNFTEFDIVVFADILRPLSKSERTHLQESIKNGSIVIISGVSPEYLSGGTTDLPTISSWFGATVYIGPSNRELENWKVKFTDKATNVMDLNLEDEYIFYTDEAWSRPIGCYVPNEEYVYAYRKDDKAATIFLHEFGDGISIYIGPRLEADYSPDIYIFRTFVESLIRSVLMINQK